MNSRIIIDPEIQHGKPVIKGTRVPVVHILGGPFYYDWLIKPSKTSDGVSHRS